VSARVETGFRRFFHFDAMLTEGGRTLELKNKDFKKKHISESLRTKLKRRTSGSIPKPPSERWRALRERMKKRKWKKKVARKKIPIVVEDQKICLLNF